MESIITDNKLSLSAKAIVLFMKEVENSVTLLDIQDTTSDKPCLIRRVLKELIEGGYITRVKGRVMNNEGEMKHGTFYSLKK